jgi:hypothetical protein
VSIREGGPFACAPNPTLVSRIDAMVEQVVWSLSEKAKLDWLQSFLDEGVLMVHVSLVPYSLLPLWEWTPTNGEWMLKPTLSLVVADDLNRRDD